MQAMQHIVKGGCSHGLGVCMQGLLPPQRAPVAGNWQGLPGAGQPALGQRSGGGPRAPTPAMLSRRGASTSAATCAPRSPRSPARASPSSLRARTQALLTRCVTTPGFPGSVWGGQRQGQAEPSTELCGRVWAAWGGWGGALAHPPKTTMSPSERSTAPSGTSPSTTRLCAASTTVEPVSGSRTYSASPRDSPPNSACCARGGETSDRCAVADAPCEGSRVPACTGIAISLTMHEDKMTRWQPW